MVIILVILVRECTLYLPSASNFENEMGEIEGNFEITILLFLRI